MTTDNDKIARNIKYLRKKARLSQEDVAKALLISRATYTAMENHPSKYTLEKLADISNLFGCNLRDFFVD